VIYYLRPYLDRRNRLFGWTRQSDCHRCLILIGSSRYVVERSAQPNHVGSLFAFALFLLSLLVPAVSTSKSAFRQLECANPEKATGGFFLLFGPFGVFAAQFGWFANPLMALSVLPVSKRLKLIFGIIAAGLAATSLTLTYLPNDIDGNAVCGFGLGLYLWLVCPIFLVIAALIKPDGRTGDSKQELALRDAASHAD
jgi:hypothetical protein